MIEDKFICIKAYVKRLYFELHLAGCYFETLT